MGPDATRSVLPLLEDEVARAMEAVEVDVGVRTQTFACPSKRDPTTTRRISVASRAVELDEEVTRAMRAVPIDFGGGASELKGRILAHLIVEESLRTVVEIGVHRARSLVALGLAARRVPGAEVWGIDPYDLGAYPDTSMGGAGPEGVAEWLEQHDWDGAHRDALGALRTLGLEATCTLWRSSSIDAAPRFATGSIDLLHVDGNHAEDAVRADLAAYLPRMRPGGIVVIDDISWRSVSAAARPALAHAERLFELVDLQNLARCDFGNDFMICRLPGG